MQKDSHRIRGTTKPIEQSARRLRQQLTGVMRKAPLFKEGI
jgi:hypothetical protein